MDETDRPDDRRAAGSWVLPNSESRRQRNHEAAKSGIPKRKKTKTYPRLSCKIEYLLTSNHSDGSIASEFFTGDKVIYRYQGQPRWLHLGDARRQTASCSGHARRRRGQGPRLGEEGGEEHRYLRRPGQL